MLSLCLLSKRLDADTILGNRLTSMRPYERFWLAGVMVLCLSLVSFAECPHFAIPQDGSGDESSATSLQAAKNQHVVFLQLRLSKSGAVKNAEVVGRPLPLGKAAIDAVKHRKFKSQVFPGASQMFVAVDFAPTDGPVPKIQEAMPAGVPGCIMVPQRVRVSQFVMRSQLLTHINPIYPPEALTKGIEGTVMLRVWIDKNGNVYHAEKVSGPDILVPAAVESVKQWKYRPFLLNGGAIEVETMVDVKFAI
jgi:TonB family protein